MGEETSYINPLESEDFREFVQETLHKYHTPGLAIALVHKDKTWSTGFGYSHLDSKKPVDARTLFFAGSTTKSFTAAAASKLVFSEDSPYKDIKWSTPLAQLIRDDFVLLDEYAQNHITIADALCHRTGMPRHDQVWINSNISVKEQVRRMRHLPLHNEIRAKWEYCNLMYIAVSHALEVLTGMSMHKILKSWIFEPLGMHETVYSLTDALELEKNGDGEAHMARAYQWDNETQEYREVTFEEIPPENGSGGIITNVLDFTHWIRQFIYPSNASNPLPADAITDMTAAQMPVPQDWQPYPFHEYGLGLEMVMYRGYKLVGHRGAIAGYMGAMYWLPDLEWGFVAFQNAWSFATYAVQFRLMDEFLDSIGAPGKAFDLKGAVAKVVDEAEEKIKNGRKTVYPNAPDLAQVAPVLPLKEYEGAYHHPAYADITLGVGPSSKPSEDGLPDAPLPLLGKGAEDGFEQQTWTFNHVSDENWWVHLKSGPGWAVTDELLKAKFEVNVEGKVSGMWLQAEKALEELAWFEKGGPNS